jgi:hypothetical protein
MGEGYAQGDILSGAAVAGQGELVDGVGPECGGGGPSGVRVDREDERGGAGRPGERVQVAEVDAPVGAVGGTIEMVRHGWLSFTG